MKSLLGLVAEDLQVNRGQPKGQAAIVCYRIAHRLRGPRELPAPVYSLPVGVAYRFFVDWFLGIEIPWKTVIGRRVRIFHGAGIVINDRSIIGDDVKIRQNVTIGNVTGDGCCPIIEDGVEIGAGAMIIGGVRVGADARIGAGAIVTKDVPPGATAYGNAAVIKVP